MIGFLGTVLDYGGKGASRWDKWRPNLALCRFEDLLIDRMELLYERRFTKTTKILSEDIKSVSPETQVNTHLLNIKDPWDFEEVYEKLHDFASKYPFDRDKEDYLVHMTTGTHVEQICLFLLSETHYIPARLVQTSPPPRKRSDQAGEYRIIDLDLSKYDRIMQRLHQEQRNSISFLKSGINTKNQQFNQLINQMEHVALNSRESILLTGPTGSGKSRLARRIYELKKVKRQVSGELVEINCATLGGDKAMSTLFGHTKGAFTGAIQNRPGLLRRADNGLLFLDEVGELGLDEQAMLLRALEEKIFLPMGSDQEVRSDFQLIAGTNRSLQNEVLKGQFREDLLARIDLWTFELPGLKDRSEDIEPNIHYELDQVARQQGEKISFHPRAMDQFMAFAVSSEAVWKANFRDLNAAIKRMTTFAHDGRIILSVVQDEISRLRKNWSNGRSNKPMEVLEDFISPERLSEIDLFDRVQLNEVIQVCQRTKNLAEAGKILFSHSRVKKKNQNDTDRLRKYLKRFDVMIG